MAISRTAIENKVWDVRIILIRRHGVDGADMLMHPLTWFVDTGRASVEFLRTFIESDPYKVADVLANECSTTEATIKALKEFMEGAH